MSVKKATTRLAASTVLSRSQASNDALVVVAPPGAGDVTVTLPTSPNDGDSVRIKNIKAAAGNSIISGGAETIDGAADVTLDTDGQAITLMYEAQEAPAVSEWKIVSSYLYPPPA